MSYSIRNQWLISQRKKKPVTIQLLTFLPIPVSFLSGYLKWQPLVPHIIDLLKVVIRIPQTPEFTDTFPVSHITGQTGLSGDWKIQHHSCRRCFVGCQPFSTDTDITILNGGWEGNVLLNATHCYIVLGQYWLSLRIPAGYGVLVAILKGKKNLLI